MRLELQVTLMIAQTKELYSERDLLNYISAMKTVGKQQTHVSTVLGII